MNLDVVAETVAATEVTPRKASDDLQALATAWAHGQSLDDLAELEAGALRFAKACGWDEAGHAEQLAAVMRTMVQSLERNNPGREAAGGGTKSDREVALSMAKSALAYFDKANRTYSKSK
jgi:hypothetical protein